MCALISSIYKADSDFVAVHNLQDGSKRLFYSAVNEVTVRHFFLWFGNAAASDRTNVAKGATSD